MSRFETWFSCFKLGSHPGNHNKMQHCWQTFSWKVEQNAIDIAIRRDVAKAFSVSQKPSDVALFYLSVFFFVLWYYFQAWFHLTNRSHRKVGNLSKLVLQTPFIISNQWQAHLEDNVDLTVFYMSPWMGKTALWKKTKLISSHWLVRKPKRQAQTKAEVFDG